jgi:hypothetical protein
MKKYATCDPAELLPYRFEMERHVGDGRQFGCGEPQVWSTAVMPILAPRCLGSAAIASVASAAALNSKS